MNLFPYFFLQLLWIPFYDSFHLLLLEDIFYFFFLLICKTLDYLPHTRNRPFRIIYRFAHQSVIVFRIRFHCHPFRLHHSVCATNKNGTFPRLGMPNAHLTLTSRSMAILTLKCLSDDGVSPSTESWHGCANDSCKSAVFQFQFYSREIYAYFTKRPIKRDRRIETLYFIFFSFPFRAIRTKILVLANNLKNSIHFYFYQVDRPASRFPLPVIHRQRCVCGRGRAVICKTKSVMCPSTLSCDILFFFLHICNINERNRMRIKRDGSHLFGPFKHLLQFICNRLSSSSLFSTPAVVRRFFFSLSLSLTSAVCPTLVCWVRFSLPLIWFWIDNGHTTSIETVFIFQYPSRIGIITYNKFTV